MRNNHFWCISFVSKEFFKRVQKTLKSCTLGNDLFCYDLSSEAHKNTLTDLKTRQNYLFSPTSFSDTHGQYSWDTFAFLGHFPIHTGPTPPLTPQTMLEICIQNFFLVSALYRVGGGGTAKKFRKGCTIL